jgi:hypothetical protein
VWNQFRKKTTLPGSNQLLFKRIMQQKYADKTLPANG